MKILYLISLLWILVALPSFAQNYKPQANNQFDVHQKLQHHKSPRRRKGHRGSGRRTLKIRKS